MSQVSLEIAERIEEKERVPAVLEKREECNFAAEGGDRSVQPIPLKKTCDVNIGLDQRKEFGNLLNIIKVIIRLLTLYDNVIGI